MTSAPLKRKKPVDLKLAGRTARALYVGVSGAFFDLLFFGAAAGTIAAIARLTGVPERLKVALKFLNDVELLVSSVSGHLCIAAVFLVHITLYLRGVYKSQTFVEHKVFHPLLVAVSGTAASALGYFTASFLFAWLPGATLTPSTALKEMVYFFLLSALLWGGRAVGEGHANKLIWRTNRNPTQNNLKALLKLSGVLGILMGFLVILLSSL